MLPKPDNTAQRVLAVVFLSIALVMMGFSWLFLYFDFKAAVDAVSQGRGMTITEGLQLDTPEFQEGFSSNLGNLSSPPKVFDILGGARTLILLLSAGVVFLLWFKTHLRAESFLGRCLFGSLIFVPFIAGLAMGPGLIVSVSNAMAEVGLSNPTVLGAGYAEAFTPAMVGGAMGLLLLIGFVFLWKGLQVKRHDSGSR